MLTLLLVAIAIYAGYKYFQARAQAYRFQSLYAASQYPRMIVSFAEDGTPAPLHCPNCKRAI